MEEKEKYKSRAHITSSRKGKIKKKKKKSNAIQYPKINNEHAEEDEMQRRKTVTNLKDTIQEHFAFC